MRILMYFPLSGVVVQPCRCAAHRIVHANIAMTHFTGLVLPEGDLAYAVRYVKKLEFLDTKLCFAQ